MRLILGDLHLLNEANDRYHKIMPNIQSALQRMGFADKIESVDLLGDILDCEYVTYKRITYFSFMMNLIAEMFSDNIRVIIGNHDKFFKNDQHYENIIRFIKFDGDIIDTPTVIDRMLYVPHYYNKDNFPAGLLDPNDFDVIIGHFGLEFVNGIEELTIEEMQRKFKGKMIISGHIHNMDLAFDRNIFLIGSMKSESWKEQSPTYSICLLDDRTPKFMIFPYHKMHLTVDVHGEDTFRDDLLELFKIVHYHNMNYCLYNKDGELERKELCDKYVTSMINIKLRVFDKNIKKRNIDLIIDYCKHEIDDPSFVNIAIKTLYQIENAVCNDDDSVNITQQDLVKIDKQALVDQKRVINDFIQDIKEGKTLESLGKNKKFTKIVDTISDGEIERFAEFLLATGKSTDFVELLKMML